MLPNGNLDFNSGIIGTPANYYGDSIQVLPDGTITYVQTMSSDEYRSYFMSTLYGTAANIYDPGFEYPMLGSGKSAYQYDPTASTWSFSGSAGLAGNGSAFTSGNPNAPQAEQVAFIQNSGVIGQAVDFAEAGTYQLSVSAAQRGNHSGGSDEEVEVLVDGTVVGTINPASTSYATYTTGSFSVTAGSHIIKFVGIDPSGADYTALLDQVNIVNVAPTGFSDPGFESPSQGSGESAYEYDPAGSTWSFSGGAGLAGNGSAFTAGNPDAPQGSQVAFIQRTGTASQVVVFPSASAGSYQITLSAAQRGNHSGGSNEEIEVMVDGSVVGTFTPASTSYANYTTASFSVTAGSHTISFVGVDPSGADYTAFLDQVSINNTPATAFAQPGFETPSQGKGASAYTYDPTGSSWTFSSMSGLSGNGSAITSGNPNAPQGSQVAFIQNTGTISQVVNFATAGSYIVSVSAAQRGNYQAGSNEEIEVEVDGTLMGTFTPGSTSYATYTSVPFDVTAGAHTITFVGVDPSGADYTALLDQASINNVSPPGFTDPSFENPSQGSGESAYQYDPTGSAWSFSGGAGLAGNDSAFTSGNSVAPQGSQVAFIQNSGTISQAVHFDATGSYQISVTAAQRGNHTGGSHEEVEVEVDGTVVGTFTPSSATYATYVLGPINLVAGGHTITFVGIDPSGADYAALLDQASILQIG